ncbi:MAG TPA: hypothetical protein ENK28_05970 [Aliiroseovarius sp.]|nr:hypothetical protein [Aliiroseovarius sp.]
MFILRGLRALVALLPMLIFAGRAGAEQVSILQAAIFQAERQPLIQITRPNAEVTLARSAASLFVGQQAGSLFAPYAPRQRRTAAVAVGVVVRSGPLGPVDRIRALIGQAESGAKRYDAVQYGATIKPPKRPTEMTLKEIFDWIAATPNQQHAIGFYQFIPSTLARLVTKLDLGPEQVFDARLQDRLADVLLAEAGLHAVSRGDIGRHTFMNNLAKIWAGLPNSTGLSHYSGIAGNRATLSWEYFDQEMRKIFPG